MSKSDEIEKFLDSQPNMAQKAKRYEADIRSLLREIREHEKFADRISTATLSTVRQYELLSEMMNIMEIAENFDFPAEDAFKRIKETLAEYYNSPAPCCG